MNRLFSRLLFIWTVVLHSSAFGQAGRSADELGQQVSWEFGGHLGNLLPSQIPGVTEITGLGGARIGYRTGSSSFLEGGVISGKSEGAEYSNAHLSLRTEIPIENIVGLAFFGADATQFKGVGEKRQVMFGGHVGGGVMALLGGNFWFRSDMKLSIRPGNSLYIGFGVMLRL